MEEVENLSFKKTDYANRDLKSKSFSDCTFESCDFTSCDLRSSKFLNCKFINCNFSLTKLDGCRLQEIVFESSKLVGINFCKCDPMFLSIKFTKSALRSCNFSGLINPLNK